MGKGGSTSTTSNTGGTSSTAIPAWLDTASQSAVSQAQSLAAQPYTPYLGQTVAGASPYTTQSYNQIEALQGQANPAYDASQAAYSGLLGSAAPISAGQLNTNTGAMYNQFGQMVTQPTAGLLGNYLGGAAPATAGQVGSNAMQLMSPYEQAVINPTLAIAQQQLAQQQQQIAGQAQNVGAFGGSRQGVQEGVAQAQSILGTEGTISNLLASGYTTALTPAYNLANEGSQQGYNAASLLGSQLASGYQNAQQQAGNLGQLNLQAGMAAAQNLPTVATAQQTQAATEAGLLGAAGSEQQAQQQAQLNSQLGQFYAAQDYPYQSLDTLLSAIGAVPYGTNTTTTGTGTTTGTTTSGLGSTIGGAVGTAGAVAGTVALIV